MFVKPELRPCLLCGSKDVVIEYNKEDEEHEFPYWQIWCNCCCLRTGSSYIEYESGSDAYEALFKAADKLIDSWNKRVGE